MAESDFQNGHAVLEQGSMGKMSREKMVYMAVKDPSQEEADMSKSLYPLSLCLSLSLYVSLSVSTIHPTEQIIIWVAIALA